MKKKVVIAVNTAWNIYNFRIGIIHELINNGYEVIALAPQDEYAEKLKEVGCRFQHISIDSKGVNPVKDLFLFLRYVMIFINTRPYVLLTYTIKPTIYASIATRILGIPTINNISGLGTVFIKKSIVTHLVNTLYKIALRKSYHVFFQNSDDRKLFGELGLIRSDRVSQLPGSGVDLQLFKPEGVGKKADGKVNFILIARMLWDKGVGDYVEAAKLVKTKFENIDFKLLGFLDVQNPSAISKKQMDEWHQSGVVQYLGSTDDVKSVIAESDCVVLPSAYREGVPRTLLEAAAMGKPIITTDTIGCKEVVDDGINGFLCRIKDPVDLANAMIKIIEMSPVERENMGMQGRKKMEREFDVNIVIQKYIETIDSIDNTKDYAN